MKADRYTQLVLTIIALALVAIALRLPGDLVPVAHAADVQTIRIEGAVELRPVELKPIEVRRMPDPVEVELRWDSLAPGSSRSAPIYVQSP